MNLSCTAITRSSCDGAPVVTPTVVVETVPGAVQHHSKDELRDVVGVPDRSVYGHHGLLFTSLRVSIVLALCEVEASWIVAFFTGSASDCEISSSRSTSYTMAQSALRTTSCTIAKSTGTGHVPRLSSRSANTGLGTNTSTDHHWHWYLTEHLVSHDLRYWNLHCLQLRHWIWSLDNLCGDWRQRYWLLNGRGLRHVRSSFHHLRQDLRHQNGHLLDVLDHARDVIHAVTQLLFPSVYTRTSTTNQDS